MAYLQSLISSLSVVLPGTNLAHFFEIISGVYSISGGGVTQLNISRYCSISYRSVQRFMSSEIIWHKLYGRLFLEYIKGYAGEYLIVIDDTVEDKAGKCTDKIGYFYSSKIGKAIKSVSFGVLSIVAVGKGKSFVLDFEQMEQDKAKSSKNKAKKAEKAKAQKAKQEALAGGKEVEKGKAGRKPGSKNKNTVKVESESYRVLEALLKRALPFLSEILIKARYLVGDGAYGNLTACLIASENDLFLISKLHHNTALFYAPKVKKGKQIYGDRVDFGDLDAHKIKEQDEEGCILTFFQLKNVRNRSIKMPLNVVIIRCFDKNTKKTGFAILFSTDLGLDGMLIAQYYSLRFQIEFNFRDAKQYFGLSDFKSTQPKQLTNAVGLSFFMVNLSNIISGRAKTQGGFEMLSILDIKACFRAILYSKTLNNTPVLGIDNILDHSNIETLKRLGVVNMNKGDGQMPQRA
jgi:putative transposase